MCLWEIVVKLRIGKLEADLEQILRAIDIQGFQHLGIAAAHLVRLTRFPFHHRDPFDHLLMAQAAAEDLTFLSEDRNTLDYPVTVMSCSD